MLVVRGGLRKEIEMIRDVKGELRKKWGKGKVKFEKWIWYREVESILKKMERDRWSEMCFVFGLGVFVGCGLVWLG